MFICLFLYCLCSTLFFLECQIKRLSVIERRTSELSGCSLSVISEARVFFFKNDLIAVQWADPWTVSWNIIVLLPACGCGTQWWITNKQWAFEVAVNSWCWCLPPFSSSLEFSLQIVLTEYPHLPFHLGEQKSFSNLMPPWLWQTVLRCFESPSSPLPILTISPKWGRSTLLPVWHQLHKVMWMLMVKKNTSKKNIFPAAFWRTKC